MLFWGSYSFSLVNYYFEIFGNKVIVGMLIISCSEIHNRGYLHAHIFDKTYKYRGVLLAIYDDTYVFESMSTAFEEFHYH